MRTNGKPNVGADEDGVIDGELMDPSGNQAMVVSQRPMMQTRTQYTTAMTVQRPRDMAEVEKRVVREAELLGEDFIYSFTVNSKDGPSAIEGTSIDGAMVLARNYGNCAVPVEVVDEGMTYWIFSATFIDFETGFNETRLYRQSKSASKMKTDAERKLDIAFQIGQSKSKRNVIDRALPGWLVNRAKDAARQAAEAKVKDLPKAIADAIAVFKSRWGVTQAQLEKRVGAPEAQWNARDIVRLRSVAKAIIDRHTSVENEFEMTGATQSPVTPTAVAPAAPASVDDDPLARPSAPTSNAAPSPPAQTPTTSSAPADATPSSDATAKTEPTKEPAKPSKRMRETGED